MSDELPESAHTISRWINPGDKERCQFMKLALSSGPEKLIRDIVRVLRRGPSSRRMRKVGTGCLTTRSDLCPCRPKVEIQKCFQTWGYQPGADGDDQDVAAKIVRSRPCFRDGRTHVRP